MVSFTFFLLALSTLEKKNKQLDSATKELEKKVKTLRQKSQLTKTETKVNLKTLFHYFLKSKLMFIT
jgi:hypothetical protein